MTNFTFKDTYNVEDLRRLVAVLRAPGGCPWDGAQTHESIRRNFIEEACEVAEAIDQQDPGHLKEELGDVLLQVLFHASIEEDAGRFNLDDVADGICKKLIFRHPHVFPPQNHSPDTPVESWEELKRREKGQQTQTQVLQSVARTLPGLWRAEKIQNKAEDAGFEWPNLQAAMDKLEEELSELKEAITQGGDTEEELGDLLFAAVKVARFLELDADTALGRTCDKFIRRFGAVEAAAAERGASLKDLPLTDLIAFWDQAKGAQKK